MGHDVPVWRRGRRGCAVGGRCTLAVGKALPFVLYVPCLYPSVGLGILLQSSSAAHYEPKILKAQAACAIALALAICSIHVSLLTAIGVRGLEVAPQNRYHLLSPQAIANNLLPLITSANNM